MGLLNRAENSTLELTQKKTGDSLPKTLEEKIAQFQVSSENINCILFEIPAHKESREGFCRRLTEILDKTGSVIPLQNGRPLILLPLSMDRELVAHRISKSLDTSPIFSFEADNPEKVIDRINSLP